MNRRVIFRGKSVDKKKWICGSLLIKGQYSDVYLIGRYETTSPTMNDPCGDTVWVEDLVIPSTVGQFSGQIDLYGNEIFEGDINGAGGVCKFILGSFMWSYGLNEPTEKLYSRRKVVGNIYDTPELISQ